MDKYMIIATHYNNAGSRIKYWTSANGAWYRASDVEDYIAEAKRVIGEQAEEIERLRRQQSLDIKRLSLKPDDIIIIKVGGDVAHSERVDVVDMLSSALKRAGHNNQVVALGSAGIMLLGCDLASGQDFAVVDGKIQKTS